MFGYVKPLKDELKVSQYTIFRSYYCGLCQHIKKEYGEIPRLVLNYDLTTLALLLDGLSPSKTYLKDSICLTSPFKKKPMIVSNEALSYGACITIALVYYKCLDDIQDDNDFKSKVLASTLKTYTTKFPPQVQPIIKNIHHELKKLTRLERTKHFSSIDEIAHPFATLVAHLLKDYPYALKDDDDILRQQLFDFGYNLGKWIYLIDALDDLEKDMQSGNFNPIAILYNTQNLTYDAFIPHVRERIAFTLFNCGCTCRILLGKLPLVRNRSLLKNIICLGMMDQYSKVTSSCGCQHHCKTNKGDANEK